MNKRNLTGQRFERLTAIRPTDQRVHHCIVWECLCECGKTCYIQSSQLLNGNVRSCGCLQTESRYKNAAGRRVGKLTAIERVPDVFYGGEPLWRWKCDCGRIVRKPLSFVGATASTMCPACRRELNRQQAREMQKKQNRDPETGMSPGTLRGLMQGKTARNNTSGVRGVTWHSVRKKWQARIFSHGKCVWVKYYDDIGKARTERQEKLIELYGEQEEQNNADR